MTANSLFDDAVGIPDRFHEFGVMTGLRGVADLMSTQAPERVRWQPKAYVPVNFPSESTIEILGEYSGRTTSSSIDFAPVIQSVLRRVHVEITALAALQRQDIHHLYEDETPVPVSSIAWGNQLAKVDVIAEDDDFDLPWA